MRNCIRVSCGLIFLTSVSFCQAVDPMKIGVAKVDITPPVPYRMSGYFSERVSTGVKDRLYAKAIVFQQGKERGALVVCDLIGISVEVADQARRQIEKEIGIPYKHISIAATHSHTGPLYFGALRKHFHDRMVVKAGKDTHEKVNYPGILVERIKECVRNAARQSNAVEIHAGNAMEKRLSFNRRFHMKGGGVRFNPGQKNPNILRAAGPIDPQVGIVSFSKPGAQKPHSALVAFALHLDTVGGTEYSADYPKHMQDRLRKSFGKDFVSVFGAGTCGDINHIDVTTKGRRTATEIGTILGETVATKLPVLNQVASPDLGFRHASVTAPLQMFSEKEIAKAKKDMELVDSSKLSFLNRVRACSINAIQLRASKSIELEVHAIRLSRDVAIVTLPGEVFVDLGIAIKTGSPFDTTLVIELANDAPGYIPTRKAFAEGSYETVNSRVQPGNGELMAKTAIRLLKELEIK